MRIKERLIENASLPWTHAAIFTFFAVLIAVGVSYLEKWFGNEEVNILVNALAALAGSILVWVASVYAKRKSENT